MSIQDRRPSSTDSPAALATVLQTDQLPRRPLTRARPDGPDPCAAIVREIPHSANHVLARAAAEALMYCEAHSAGSSVLVAGAAGNIVSRLAVVGPWAQRLTPLVPPSSSHDGVTMQSAAAQLFCRPERWCDDLATVQPLAAEILVVPLYRTREVIGALWVVSHDEDRQFDLEDQRRLEMLSRCTSAAYDVSLSIAQRVTEPASWARKLSHREREVCIYVARGHTSTAIAAFLGVSAKTVETYRARAADKLGFRTRAELVARAREYGWI